MTNGPAWVVNDRGERYLCDSGRGIFSAEQLPRGEIVFGTVAIADVATGTFHLRSFGRSTVGEVLPPLERVIEMFAEAAAVRWGYQHLSVTVLNALETLHSDDNGHGNTNGGWPGGSH